MTEQSAERTASTEPTTKSTASDPCPDPTGWYIDYQVAVSAAAKRSELYAADKEKIDEKYKKLAEAQKRFADAKQEQQKAWESLQRKIDCVDKAIKLTEEEKKRLYECWKTELDKVKKATEPADCDKIPDCDKLHGKGIAELRQQRDNAKNCVTWYDKKFDDLAELSEKLSDKITGLTTKATKLEDDIAAPNSDLMRIYRILGLLPGIRRCEALVQQVGRGIRLRTQAPIRRSFENPREVDLPSGGGPRVGREAETSGRSEAGEGRQARRPRA
jgi:DNA repair exonuclease SbcCD ATPase subunit